jgi:cytochrome P450
MLKPKSNGAAIAAMLRELPGPALSPMRQALAFARDQYRFLDEHRRALGDVFSFRIPGEPPRVIVGAPAEIKKVLALRPEDYYSADPSMHVNIGESCVLFADGQRHQRDRQLLAPPLHGEMLSGFGDTIVRTTQAAVARWKPGSEIVLHEAAASVTLEIITRCILGAEAPERAARLRELMRAWLEVTLSPAMFALGSLVGLNRMRRWLEARSLREQGQRSRLPYPGRHSVQLKAELMTLLAEDVEACRRGTDGRTDVLALLARARHEDGEPMPTRTAVDQLVLLMMAGHETTAKTLCWAVLDVLRRPAVLTRIRAELEGGVTPARVRELPYLNAVIKESMRLTPVTTVLQRELTRPIELGGHTIPAGVLVVPSNYLAQRHEATWGDPLAFRPERFLEAARPPAPHEYFPFGGGRRRCLGAEFAGFELPLMLATLLERAELALVARADHRPRYGGITIGPADGLRLRYLGPRGAMLAGPRARSDAHADHASAP